VSWEIPVGPKHALPPTRHFAAEILFEENRFLSNKRLLLFPHLALWTGCPSALPLRPAELHLA